MSEREMTLKEYINQLPTCHLANQEYVALQERIETMEARIERLEEILKSYIEIKGVSLEDIEE